MKLATLEEKVKYLRNNIISKDSSDTVAVLNILNLISNSNLSDELMKEPNIIFKDLADFSDIKTELKQDLDTLKLELATYYLSILTSCRTVKVRKKEDIKEIPDYIKLLLANLGFFNLNTILNKYINKIDTSKLLVVEAALPIMNQILTPMYALDGVVNKLFLVEDK